jgi:undecaprenyl-diphosphatase
VFEDFLAQLTSIDLAWFHSINGWSGRSPILDRVQSHLEDARLKGILFSATFGALWFQRTKFQLQRRETLVLTLLAIVLSIIAARGFADLLPFRQRPMFTADIGFRPPLFQINPYFADWSSFPSDTAALVFAMTTGFFLVSRWWGLLWTIFSILAISARVYFGLHFPIDVIVGSFIGIVVTVTMNCQFMHARVASPIISLEQKAPAVFYAFLFAYLFEVSSLFVFTRYTLEAMVHMLRSL